MQVLDMDHAPLSQEYLKRGCPHSLRGCVWAQVSSMTQCVFSFVHFCAPLVAVAHISLKPLLGLKKFRKKTNNSGDFL